jgi:hypothetical protein
MSMRPSMTVVDIIDETARQLAQALVAHHADLMASGDIEAREAIIVKSVALLVLAFGIPAVDGEPADQEEALENLAWAIEVIAEKEELARKERVH